MLHKHDPYDLPDHIESGIRQIVNEAQETLGFVYKQYGIVRPPIAEGEARHVISALLNHVSERAPSKENDSVAEEEPELCKDGGRRTKEQIYSDDELEYMKRNPDGPRSSFLPVVRYRVEDMHMTRYETARAAVEALIEEGFHVSGTSGVLRAARGEHKDGEEKDSRPTAHESIWMIDRDRIMEVLRGGGNGQS